MFESEATSSMLRPFERRPEVGGALAGMQASLQSPCLVVRAELQEPIVVERELGRRAPAQFGGAELDRPVERSIGRMRQA